MWPNQVLSHLHWNGSALQALCFLGLCLTFSNSVSAIRISYRIQSKSLKLKLPSFSTATAANDLGIMPKKKVM